MKTREKLNVYLSNMGVLNVKLHNIHWNVVGKEFVQVHQYTESVYDKFFEKFDEVAELLKINGEMPLASLKDYLAHATVKELEARQFSTMEALELVQADLELMKAMAIDIRLEADEAEEFAVVAMMEEHIGEYSKDLWFLRSILAK